MNTRRPRGLGQHLLVAGFIAPALLLLLVFVVAPGIWAVAMSFTDWKLTGEQAVTQKLVGFTNYTRLISSESFQLASLRTVVFVFFSAIVGQFLLGLASALVLARKDVRMKGIFGGSILMPLIVPESVAAFAWASVLTADAGGTANRLIGIMGAEPVSWLRDWALPAVIVVNIWRGIAFAMILFQAAIEGISSEVMEAARVDGATPSKLLRYITLPLIRHAILLYMLLTTIGTVTVFGLIYFLTRGGPGGETTTLAIFIYERAFKFFEVGYGSAASVMLLGVVLAIGLVYVRLLRAEI